MTNNDYKEMLLRIARLGYPDNTYLSGKLIETANTPSLLNKLHSRAQLVAYRYCISVYDATFSLIHQCKL